MKARRLWLWGAFGGAAAAMVGALLWVSLAMLALEKAETGAQREARYQQSLRLAVTRLDAAALRLLAQEAGRPHDVYDPFYYLPQPTYTRTLQQIEENEILTRSPILARKPEYARLHFQIAADGAFSSPQVPSGNYLERSGLDEQAVAANRRTLEYVCKMIDPGEFGIKLEQAEQWSKKVQQRAPQIAAQAETAVVVGPFEGIWEDGELYFLRRVEDHGEKRLQGFLTERNVLDEYLLSEIADLFPNASLAPAHDDELADGRLVSMPFRLVAPRPQYPPPGWTATHTVLALVWPTILLAFLFAAVALRRSIAFGDKQRGFASLVTHELRSPLTTFRLYAEMLAEGLVADEAKRATYLTTLQKEADQMARTVENVITHARIESGRAQLARQRITVGALLTEIEPDLAACAAKAGMGLAIESGGAGDAALETDPGAVGQILLNLVENACRYGASDRDPAILVSASVSGTIARIAVRDHGPGVPAAVQRRIFRPFDRGDRDETSPIRGLGLGLALSRGLARDLGGELTLEDATGGGARFVLSLPTR
jgi:signal transduction histidine kinase